MPGTDTRYLGMCLGKSGRLGFQVSIASQPAPVQLHHPTYLADARICAEHRPSQAQGYQLRHALRPFVDDCIVCAACFPLRQFPQPAPFNSPELLLSLVKRLQSLSRSFDVTT
ncbi:hypothetical protein CGMCC3_g8557 [Colletotrichum fructicola]|nr:uncharacterized protein CGMCC3_g8557 [Colletotrichum fructicola]KAE9575247.1 hypothetical protein CGMCC3_g8557 [Colletotrichum fructicola]